MCTLAQTPTTNHYHQHTNNTMNNSNLYNNIIVNWFNVNFKGNVMNTIINAIANVLFNKSMNFHSELEVDVMCNDIQYTNEYEVDLNSNHPVYSDATQDEQFEAEIDALYADDYANDSVPMSLPSDMMASIMAFAAANANNNNVNSDVSEESAMCNDKCPVCENGLHTNKLCATCEAKMLNESYVDKHGSDVEEDDMDKFSVIPVLALAADTTYATMTGNEKIMLISALVCFIVAAIAAIPACIWYEKKQKANKLAIAERWLASEHEQTARANAVARMQQRENEIERQRQIAAQEAYAAQCVREQQEAQMKALKDAVNAGDKRKEEELKFALFIKEICGIKNNDDLWNKLDMEIEEKITWEAAMKASQDLNDHADYSFFYKNASIQGIRSFMFMIANLNEWDAANKHSNSIYHLFNRFAYAIERTLKANDYQYYNLVNTANWCFADASTRILTKIEWEAAKLLLQKRHPVFFANWYFPLNDAAVGGLLLAMSKDPAFADQMYAVNQEHNFWRNKEMNNEKSLWKAAQWKNYLARYNNVKELKEDLMPIFAESKEVATCKLTTDIVVGFNFNKKEFESCDVADTDQIEKILSAGYDQVLRIRRTDAAGIWNESKQINQKYAGNFCTGYGATQSHGYYQETFLNGTNIPWVADIQINGNWDNFGVILTNSAGVVDFGMGNDNRSKKHRSVLHYMFGNGESNVAMYTPGQREALHIYHTWFIQREFNINHVVAQIKAKLAAINNNA